MKTRLFKYIENFTTKKEKKIQIKFFDIFHFPAQNIDCVYSLEPPWRGVSNEYQQSMFFSKIRKTMNNPVNLSFTIYKSGVLRGSKLRQCFRDAQNIIC